MIDTLDHSLSGRSLLPLIHHHEHHPSPKLFDSPGLDAMHLELMALEKSLSFEKPLITQITIFKLMLFSPVLHHVLGGEELLLAHITRYNVFLDVLFQLLLVLKSPGAMIAPKHLVLAPHMARQVSH